MCTSFLNFLAPIRDILKRMSYADAFSGSEFFTLLFWMHCTQNGKRKRGSESFVKPVIISSRELLEWWFCLNEWQLLKTRYKSEWCKHLKTDSTWMIRLFAESASNATNSAFYPVVTRNWKREKIYFKLKETSLKGITGAVAGIHLRTELRRHVAKIICGFNVLYDFACWNSESCWLGPKQHSRILVLPRFWPVRLQQQKAGNRFRLRSYRGSR